MVLTLKNKTPLDQITDTVYQDPTATDLLKEEIKHSGFDPEKVYIDYQNQVFTIYPNSFSTGYVFATYKKGDNLQASLDKGYQDYLKNRIKNSHNIIPICLKTDQEIVDDLMILSKQNQPTVFKKVKTPTRGFSICRLRIAPLVNLSMSKANVGFGAGMMAAAGAGGFWSASAQKQRYYVSTLRHQYRNNILDYEYDTCESGFDEYDRYIDYNDETDNRVIEALLNDTRWLHCNLLNLISAIGYFRLEPRLYDKIIEQNRYYTKPFLLKAYNFVNGIKFIRRNQDDDWLKNVTITTRKKVIESFRFQNKWEAFKFRLTTHKLLKAKNI